MGGGAPAVGPNGDLWVETGPDVYTSAKHAYTYDDSDGVLEISPSLRLVQFFAPANWVANNGDDLDMSAEPVLLPDGQVILAGKSQVIYLLNGSNLGGIGKQEAELSPVCSTNIDGGSAHIGMIAYLPCTSGVIAVKATRSPARLHLLWTAPVAGGPPIVAGGLVWTFGQNGHLYGLDPATGEVRQQAEVGTPANHFPTPGIGAGLMLVPGAPGRGRLPHIGRRRPGGRGRKVGAPRRQPLAWTSFRRAHDRRGRPRLPGRRRRNRLVHLVHPQAAPNITAQHST